ncbi:MAG: TldD/PmbA family protein [Firmicutes bacterium]|jgi:predicted Zn-dependent protease|nr:TldD/PmbA family protein [Bacillota bacterium]
MVGKDRAYAILDAALAASLADMTEAVLLGVSDGLTRFANSEIHQNVVVEDAALTVRAILGSREGRATTNELDPDSVARAVARAAEIASMQPDNPEFPGLPEPSAYQDTGGFDQRTATCSPVERARRAGMAIAMADSIGASASGSLRTRVREIAVANSNGVYAWTAGTDATFVTVVMGKTGSGYAIGASGRLDALDLEEMGRRAVDKCISSEAPGDLEPGEYVAILEPPAVATMLEMLAYMGINGAAYLEGRSYASGRMGQPVTSPMISIEDDGLDPDSVPIPFDFEGVPRRPVRIIDQGVVSGMVFDRMAAKRAGAEPTGHALPGSALRGGFPLHLRLAPGDSSVEKMIQSTDRGVLVTRFNYANPIHPQKTVFTGMTRDGTFLVEGGRITRPLRNLRFTDSILGGVLAHTDLISRDTALIPVLDSQGFYKVPALRTTKLNFTGATA